MPLLQEVGSEGRACGREGTEEADQQHPQRQARRGGI